MSFPNLQSPPQPSAATIIITQPQYGAANSTTADVVSDASSPSQSSSTSIIIVTIVISSAIIVSVIIYCLLRLLSRRCLRTFRTFSTVTSSAVDDVVMPTVRPLEDRRGANRTVLDSLPLFTFGSVHGNLTGGDCAVCLSKFEPQDQLRLLPLCCHAFHASCIGAWLASNLTCPLCRSNVNPTDSDILNKILASEEHSGGNGNGVNRSGSFRVEIGSVSRRGDSGDDRRTYSVGSFDYVVDDACEVPVASMHQRGVSECTDKESALIPVTGPPGENLETDVSGGNRTWWLRDYVDRLSSFSFSSRTMSFRSSGRFFVGSSRRSEVVVPVVDNDLEANRHGEEISEIFRWLSGV